MCQVGKGGGRGYRQARLIEAGALFCMERSERWASRGRSRLRRRAAESFAEASPGRFANCRHLIACERGVVRGGQRNLHMQNKLRKSPIMADMTIEKQQPHLIRLQASENAPLFTMCSL